jgi:transcriptional regulator with XRE-family HTH domain
MGVFLIDVPHENLRYEVWSRRGELAVDLSTPEGWQRGVLRLTGWAPARCREVVMGASLAEEELAHLESCFGWAEDQRMARLVEADPRLLAANIDYLVSRALPADGGRRADLARDLGVHRSQIGRWCNGASVPSQENLDRLKARFGLGDSVDLRTEPLFLHVRPVTLSQRKQRLLRRLESIPFDELREVLPALEKLLEVE